MGSGIALLCKQARVLRADKNSSLFFIEKDYSQKAKKCVMNLQDLP